MNKIYIGNIPYTTKEQDLEEVFTSFGQIDEVTLIKERETGRSRGYGFITYSSKEAADKALTMDGKDFMGRKLRVNLAKEKSEGGGGGRKNFRSGGGGGDRYARQGGGGGRYDRED